ncbi:MAG: ABC transporter [Oceanospirillaceae bacterium]|nr:ABC transporter [Oceanospirillaceae bacterium]
MQNTLTQARSADAEGQAPQPQERPVLLEARAVGQRVSMGGETLEILKAVNLSVHQGESVAIVGASGSGKSTLLGLLAGLDVASDGDIILLGQSLNGLDEDGRASLRAQDVTFVFQSFHLLPGLTALENVMLPLEISQRAARNARATASSILSEVGLQHRQNHYPQQLSGGEQQRVAIARAFAGQPRIVFADEPTGNLDRATGKQIEDLMFGLNRQQGTTLVLVTHDERLAQRCDRIVRMEDGQLSEQTTPASQGEQG